MRRTKSRALETKHSILDASLEIFSEKNYSSVTVAEIAGKIGMTKGAVYWHFRNKEDILVKIIEDFCGSADSGSISADTAPQNIDGLRARYKTALAMFTGNARYCKTQKLMLHCYEWPEKLQSAVFDIIRASDKKEACVIEELLRKAQEIGQLRMDFDTQEVAVLISSVFHGLRILQISDLLPGDFARQTDFLFDALEKGMQ